MDRYDTEWVKDVERRLVTLETKAAVTEVSKAHMDAKFQELKDEIKSITNSLQNSQRWFMGIVLTPLVGAIILFIVKGGLHSVPGVN